MFSRFWSTVTEDQRKHLITLVLTSDNNKIIDYLEENKIDINDCNLVDESKNTLLHLAVATKNLLLTRYLIEHKSDRSKKNLFGDNPMKIAMKNHDEYIIQELLDIYNQDNQALELEKSNHKRTRDERDELLIENKKLKKDNLELQNTVKSLRSSFKK